MLTSTTLPQKTLKIKLQDDNEFFSKRLTTNVSISMANFFAEGYHGEASIAVPFVWESQPGTPKIKLHENPLPPLTPPPSYFYSITKTPNKKHSKPNLLDSIFPKRPTRKTSTAPVSPASSSSSSLARLSPSSSSSPRSSSYYSISSSPTMGSKTRGRHGISSPRRSFDSRMALDDDHEGNECESPVSALCFCIGRGANSTDRSRGGCYASMIKVLIA